MKPSPLKIKLLSTLRNKQEVGSAALTCTNRLAKGHKIPAWAAKSAKIDKKRYKSFIR